MFRHCLIRLQCYEGLDRAEALYEWNYQRQLLTIQARTASGNSISEDDIFSERFLLERPLLQAIRQERPPVLLIDEIDRADEEFEAFLLELLSDFQVTIPELGTTRPELTHVVMTSNGTAKFHACGGAALSLVDTPTWTAKRNPATPASNIGASFAGKCRMLEKVRGRLRRCRCAETLDWAAALIGLEIKDLHSNPETVFDTMMCLLKTQEDRSRFTREVAERLLGKVA